MDEPIVIEDNEANLTSMVEMKNEQSDNQMMLVKTEDDEDIEIIHEIPGNVNFLQILNEEVVEEIDMRNEPLHCEYNKDVATFEIKEELMKNDVNENEIDCYKSMILKALNTVEDISGAFACGGILPKPKLQLTVKGVGNIILPLSLEQADVLKTKCEVAPFGRGAQTLVNKSVRNALQIDAEDITLNEEFNEFMEEKMTEIIPNLMGESFTEDILPSIAKHHKLELYKLVYYQQGGHFVAHRDTEKSPGMFATLVVQLPAGHTGGALVINHKGHTEVFDHQNNSRTNFFFTAFFADCEHELREITSGHRLVLIYNIIRKNSLPTIHPQNKDEKFLTTMKKAVSKWESDKNGPYHLALKLDFLYTDKNVSFQSLKGKDKKISDALCSSVDIEVFLATITKIETRTGHGSYDRYSSYKRKRYHSYNRYRSFNSWGSDDSMSDNNSTDESMSDEESERQCYYTLTNWIGANNIKKNYGQQRLDKNEILINEEDMFEDNYELHKSAVEYTGNSGCTQEYTYKKTAIVICPKSHAFLLACKEDLTSVIAECKNISEQGVAWEKAWEILHGIMDYVKRHDSNASAMMQLKKNDNVSCIFEILCLLQNSTKSAIFFLKAFLDTGLPTANSGVALAKLINKLTLESLGDHVLQLVQMRVASHTQGFEQLVRSLLIFGLQEQAIKVVEVGTPKIIAQKGAMSSENLAHWFSLLASSDILSTHYYDFFQHILSMKDDIIIQILSEMHKSIQPRIKTSDKIIECFENILYDLQDKGWKNLSPKSVILVIPVIVLIDKTETLKSLVQSLINHENSSDFLEPILKLPIVIVEKDNPSVQLMVHTRLQQLEKLQPPVFSWAQPNATLVNRPIHDRGPRSGPLTSDIHKFLRSDEKSKTFGRFESIKHARCFGRKYFPDGKYNKTGQYSAEHEAFGIGCRAQCTITKTRKVFDEQVKRYSALCAEASDLNPFTVEFLRATLHRLINFLQKNIFS